MHTMPTIEFQNFDEETLRRVERNDPDVRGLTITQDVDWIEGAGRIIGENTSLQGIQIDVGSDDGGTRYYWHQELFQGLSRNRSIESLELTFHFPEAEVDVFHTLAPFFENNSNLHYLRVNQGWTQIKSLASILSKCNKAKCQLQCVEVCDCPDLDEDMELLLNSLHGIATLFELELCDITLGRKGRTALVELLNKSNIHTLGLQNSSLDEDCALITENNVTSLREIGWYSLSVALAHPLCKLEKLFLACTDIDDQGITCLGEGLAINRTLKYLDLSCKTLFITATGWQGFSKCMRNTDSVLEEIDLAVCSIDDDGAAAIVDAFVGNSFLKKLNMGFNQLITASGWIYVFRTLLNFVPSLEELVATEAFEDSYEIDWADDMDWTVLLRALCDSSSVDRTFSSNHIFHSLQGEESSVLTALPDEIYSLLQMNKYAKNKAEVSREKILKYHFAGGVKNIHEFCRIPLASMPVAFGWIGRSNHGLSLMYSVVRELPTLFKQRC